MNLTKRLRPLDPLHAFPYELWLECIKLYARDQAEGPLPLFDISKAWRGRLLETPQLWTTIFYDGGSDEDCRAECFFHLSGNLPIELVVGRTPGTMNGARKYGHRIKSYLFWGNNVLPDTTFGASFLPYKLDDGWYSDLIRLYIVPPRNQKVPLASTMANASSTLGELLQRRTSMVDQHDPEAVTLKANLSAIYYYEGQYEMAEQMALKVVNLRINSFGELHPDTVVALSNLAMIYVSQKHPNKASPLFYTLSRLAVRYTSRGQRLISEELQVEILEQSRLALGEEHPDSIDAAKTLIYLYEKQNRCSELTQLQEEVLRQCRTALGMEHPESITALTALIMTYRTQRREKDAVKLEVESLEYRRRIQRIKSPDSVAADVDLASKYRFLERWEDAERLDAEVLEQTRRRALDHIAAALKVADFAHDQGGWYQAERLYTEVLEKRKQILGQEHRDTVAAASSLALTYRRHGRLEEAERLHAKVLEQRKRILGQDHCDTILTASNLAVTYHTQGRWDKAEKLKLYILEQRRRTLGQEHPDTILAAVELAYTYGAQGRWKEDVAHLAPAVDLSLNVLGSHHRDTQCRIRELMYAYKKLRRYKKARETEALLL